MKYSPNMPYPMTWDLISNGTVTKKGSDFRILMDEPSLLKDLSVRVIAKAKLRTLLNELSGLQGQAVEPSPQYQERFWRRNFPSLLPPFRSRKVFILKRILNQNIIS